MNPVRFTWVVALVFDGLLSCSGLQTGMQTPRYRIPLGMRAVVVRVNGVAGILRGRRVDVLVTDDSIGTTDPHTTTVVQGAEVLASEKVKTHGGAVVTLLTSPKDAEKLTLASQQGRVSLVPRN
jgi:Flp pilus assembly protein CpaB